MKISCITIDGNDYEMDLTTSDLKGFYLYKLIPRWSNEEPKMLYIAPNRESYLMDGKQLDSRNILHYFTFKSMA